MKYFYLDLFTHQTCDQATKMFDMFDMSDKCVTKRLKRLKCLIYKMSFIFKLNVVTFCADFCLINNEFKRQYHTTTCKQQHLT